MRIDGNEIRVGNIIEHKNRLWVATKTEHVKPGKGGAYMQVELKDIRSGTKLNERFRADEAVERVRVDERPYQFLFAEGNTYTFMDQETFEQIELKEDFLGAQVARCLKDGMEVTLSMHEDEVLSVNLPENITMEVVEADPVVKGQTAAASYKPAILENGMRITVPPHIEAGTRVVINTGDMSYQERAKE